MYRECQSEMKQKSDHIRINAPPALTAGLEKPDMTVAVSEHMSRFKSGGV